MIKLIRNLCNLPVKYTANSLVAYYNSDLNICSITKNISNENISSEKKENMKLIEYYNSDEYVKNSKNDYNNKNIQKIVEYYNGELTY